MDWFISFFYIYIYNLIFYFVFLPALSALTLNVLRIKSNPIKLFYKNEKIKKKIIIVNINILFIFLILIIPIDLFISLLCIKSNKNKKNH